MNQNLGIKINENSRIPKYKQIVDAIINQISRGDLKVGRKIPSINGLSEELLLSRDTVEKAYKILKKRKIIVSIKGKGYYTAKTDLISKLNILLLINKPSNYKMMIYDAMVEAIGLNGHVHLSIYHCDEEIFVRYIEKNLHAYDYYALMLHFRDSESRHISLTKNVLETIDKIPKDKLLLIDNAKPKAQVKGNYGIIYQNFEKDIYNALNEAYHKLKEYSKIILIFPEKWATPYPKRILRGFLRFCQENNLDYEVLNEIYEDMEFESKDAYITIRERDLINLVQQIRAKNLILGKDVGIISYNDTPLKELLGITVISTDFKAMGQSAAYMMLKNKRERVKNVFKYTERNSI